MDQVFFFEPKSTRRRSEPRSGAKVRVRTPSTTPACVRAVKACVVLPAAARLVCSAAALLSACNVNTGVDLREQDRWSQIAV